MVAKGVEKMEYFLEDIEEDILSMNQKFDHILSSSSNLRNNLVRFLKH